MPHDEQVRSLIRPKNGLANTETSEATPATNASLLAASSAPTRELTFSAKVTSSGARNNSEVPISASVYSEMNPHPTLVGTCWVAAPGGVGSTQRSAGSGKASSAGCGPR